MNSVIASFTPEFYLSASSVILMGFGAVVALLFSLSQGILSKPKTLYLYTLGLMSLSLVSFFLNYDTKVFLGGAWVIGDFARFGQILVVVLGMITSVFFYESQHRKDFFSPEITALYLMCLTGMVVLVSSFDLVTAFIGLELASISLYVLVGYIRTNRTSIEGALKYFILGSFATGFLLFGMALIYGVTGALDFTGISLALMEQGGSVWAYMGGAFFIAGLAFKLALVPFHLWAPDVYESAPTSLTAFMSTAVKVVIVVLLVRFLAPTMDSVGDKWVPMVSFLAIASIVVGNFMALVQNTIKRMLAYSSIAHGGYICLGLAAMAGQQQVAVEAVVFYLGSYCLTSLLSFGAIIWLERSEKTNLQFEDIHGLASKHPVLAFFIALSMISLAGLPPTVGFIGKFFLFKVALADGLYGLVIFGVLGSVVSLYYYLKVLVSMYMKPSQNTLEGSPNGGRITGVVMAAAAIGIVVFGTLYAGKGLDFTVKPAVAAYQTGN